MRKIIFLIILAFVTGIFATELITAYPGYVYLSAFDYTIEANLWVFFVVQVITFFTVYILLKLIKFVWSLLTMKIQIGRDPMDQARLDSNRGLLSLANEDWPKAERNLVNAADAGYNPLVNYLAAARAAYEQGKLEQSDKWMKAAELSTKNADLAVAIIQIQLLVSRNQLEQALAIILLKRKKYSKNQQLLKMQLKVLIELGDWVEVQKLLPKIRKASPLSPKLSKSLKQVEQKLVIQLMDQAFHSQGADQARQITAAYEDASRQIRFSPDVLLSYTGLLLELGQQEKVEQVLRQSLSSNVWHDDLIDVYGRVTGRDQRKQLLFAEKQLKERPNDAILLLALGRIANRLGDQTQAIEYLEAASKIKSMPAVHTELGNIMTKEGDFEGACEQFNKALS